MNSPKGKEFQVPFVFVRPAKAGESYQGSPLIDGYSMKMGILWWAAPKDGIGPEILVCLADTEYDKGEEAKVDLIA